ncbi:Telomerase reverse transcriptase [Vanrija albida]|uniref:Telomerase reverse transcriptase n=1 Tax=Vanrija albida TaxID=181172 RepID=A0ABR3Q0L7_9TREE
MDTRRGDPGPKTLRHKTLSAYYERLVTLGGHLAAPVGDELVYHSDPAEYHALLRSTVCAPLVHGHGDWPPRGPAEGTQQEALDRLIGELGKGGGERRDVLLGPKTADRKINMSRPGVDAGLASQPSSVLRSTPWKILRSRLGDARFRYLFLTTALFAQLGNNCYMQLSGPPIYKLYDQVKARREVKPEQKRKAVDKGRERSKRRKGEDGARIVNIPSTKAANLTLARQIMFYGRPSRTASRTIVYGLPRNHPLNRCYNDPSGLPTDQACLELLRVVFPSTPSDESALKGKRTGKMLGVMRELLVAQKKINYRALLRMCVDRQKDVDLVCRFLSSVLHKLLSGYITGGEHNRNVISRNAHALIRAKMYEPISVHTLLQGLRINDMTWLAAGEDRRVPPQEAIKRRQLAQEFLTWLFDSYIIPLLRSSFYVTETADTRYETVYYPHAEWAQATEPHLRVLENNLLEELDQGEAEAATRGQLGVSVVRLIPKPTGFRPIVNLGRRIRVQNALGVTSNQAAVTSANDILRTVHQVLTFEKDRKRALLGASLFGTNEIFAPVNGLKTELVARHGSLPRLYFAKMDIKAAFDTIKQEKMLQIVERLLDEDYDYCLMMYCMLLPPASKASQGTARRLFKTRADVNEGDVSNFGEYAQAIAKPFRNAVLVDMVRRKEVTRDHCVQLLRTHIQSNVWKVNNKLFRQKTGIPQGSTISSLLCSFFYASMEAEYLSWTRRPGTRLLRYIDDFLLVTDDYAVARRFVETMHHGFPDYGAFVSPNKTLLSFELAPGGLAAPVAPVHRNGSCYFPYCGFLIDASTLDISIDHDRLLAGPTCQSFALRSSRNRGAGFVGWLSRQLENRNHVAFLDTHHNDLDTVYLNVFVNFGLTAMKIPHYFGLGSTINESRADVVYGWILMSVDYTYSAGRARVRHHARGDEHEHFNIGRAAFGFLAKTAIRHVLGRQASRFGSVANRLERDLATKGSRGFAARLSRVVNRGLEIVDRAEF